MGLRKKVAATGPKLPWAGNIRKEFQGSSKRSALLLPGLGTSARVWERQAAALAAAADATVRVESLAGHDGSLQSFREASAADWYTTAERVLLELFRQSGEPVLLSGFSAGGLVATKLALRNPDAVRALFLTGYCPRLKSQFKEKFLRFCGVLGQVPGLRRFVRKMSFAAEGNTRTDLLTKEYLTQPRYSRYPLRSLLNLLELQDELYNAVLQLRCPVRFFHGVHDTRTPLAMIENLADLMGKLRGDTIPINRYELSPHCVPLGLDAEVFTADVVAAAGEYWV